MRSPCGWIGIGGGAGAARSGRSQGLLRWAAPGIARTSFAVAGLGWLRWGGGVVLKELVPDGVDRLVRLEVQDQVRCQGAGSVLPALGQLLHLLAEFRERFDRVRLIVSLQNVGFAVGID